METENFTVEQEAHTGVAYIDLCEPIEDAKIDVIDVGIQIGFPSGQVLLRVDREHGVLLGITIHEFASFKRRLMWHYRIASIQRGIQLLVASLRAGMGTCSTVHAYSC